MSRLLTCGASALALMLWTSAVGAQSSNSPNTAAPPGTPVSPLPAPDASTTRGQGVAPRPNQPAPPPSPTQTENGPQSGSTLPGSPVSPVPAPDASTAHTQDMQNGKESMGGQYGNDVTEPNGHKQ
jgi:hypothetical protein